MKTIIKKGLSFLAASIASQIKPHSDRELRSGFPVYFPTGPNKTPTIFIHNRYGQRVFLDPADYFITSHFLEILEWEEHLEEVYKDSFLNGGTYLDIGANVGLHVLRAHRLGATKTYAFEPVPNTFDILSININAGGLSSNPANCAIGVNCALGEKEGVLGMNLDDYTPSMARIEEGNNASLEVPVKTLNNFSDEHPEIVTEKLSLVKVDVEGHEGEVINGAIDFLKKHSDFNLIVEFGSPSSVQGVQLLDQHFTFSMKLYRWMQGTIEVDMNFVNTEENRLGGDLVLFGLKPK